MLVYERWDLSCYQNLVYVYFLYFRKRLALSRILTGITKYLNDCVMFSLTNLCIFRATIQRLLQSRSASRRCWTRRKAPSLGACNRHVIRAPLSWNLDPEVHRKQRLIRDPASVYQRYTSGASFCRSRTDLSKNKNVQVISWNIDEEVISCLSILIILTVQEPLLSYLQLKVTIK